MLNPIQNKYISQRNIIGDNTVNNGITVGSQNTVNTNSLSQLTCQFVTLTNYDLNGTETVDGMSPSDGDLILVANQTDKSENGVYQYSTSGDWDRQTGIKGGQLITITNGATKEGSLWVIETTTFSEGTDDIDIIEQSLTRKDGDFAGFSTFTLATSDILLAEDVSNSNAKGKVTISDVLGLYSGTQLDTVEKTLYVSPNFTETGQFYNDLETAITFANDETEAYTIIVFKGTYEINSTISYDHTIVCIDAVIKQYNVSNPALTFDAGSIIGNAIITDEGKTPTEYLIKVENNCVIEADRIESDYGAIHFAQTEPTTTDVEIRANYIDKIKEDSSNGTLAKIDANWLTDLEIDGSSSSVITVNGKLMTGNVAINNGRTNLSVTNYDRGSINVVTVTGGTLVLTGRMEHYADVTPPVVQSSGTLVMNQFFGKNGSGSVVSGSGGTLLMANSVLEAGSVGGGGASATISATPSYTVKYNNASSLNTAPTGGLTEQVTGNKTTDGNVTI